MSESDHPTPRGTPRPGRDGRPPLRDIVGTALLLGVTGDLLVRSPQDPGLNVLLAWVALALGVRRVTRAAGRPPGAEAWSWMLAGILLASGAVLRAAPALQLLAFVGAAAAFAFPTLRAGVAWTWRSGPSDYLEAVIGTGAFTALGGFHLAADTMASTSAPGQEDERSGTRRGAAVLRGLLLAAPLLFLFGALFMSADRVFARIVTDLTGSAVEEWASHLLVTCILGWLAAGYLTGFLRGTRLRGAVPEGFRPPSVGIVEAGVALGLVDLLFAAFVSVQFRYLFGGADLVEVTPGLTYAEYAREGFAQLAFASALVLPVLLLSDWLLRGRTFREAAVFRGLGGLQLLLLGAVIASAFQRVWAYQEAYGLTESRFYGTAFLGWLVLLGAWFGATVLRGRRARFAFPAVVSGFAVVAGLFLVSPDAWIARTNLARAGLGIAAFAPETTDGAGGRDGSVNGTDRRGDGGVRPVDVSYLASLSADAVPTLLRALPRLRPDARCELAGLLLERWGDDGELDWRSWNLAVARARNAVREAAPELGDPACHPNPTM